MNVNRFTTLLLIGLLIGLHHCGKPNNPAVEGDVVVWSELRVLDELSESAILFIKQNQTAALRDAAGILLNSGRLVVKAEPPANAKQLEQVKLLQRDLDGLVNDEPESLTDEELIERVNAIHAIVVKMMEAAGMPHIHNHDNHDEHGEHDGHNH